MERGGELKPTREKLLGRRVRPGKIKPDDRLEMFGGFSTRKVNSALSRHSMLFITFHFNDRDVHLFDHVEYDCNHRQVENLFKRFFSSLENKKEVKITNLGGKIFVLVLVFLCGDLSRVSKKSSKSLQANANDSMSLVASFSLMERKDLLSTVKRSNTASSVSSMY